MVREKKRYLVPERRMLSRNRPKKWGLAREKTFVQPNGEKKPMPDKNQEKRQRETK